MLAFKQEKVRRLKNMKVHREISRTAKDQVLEYTVQVKEDWNRDFSQEQDRGGSAQSRAGVGEGQGTGGQ